MVTVEIDDKIAEGEELLIEIKKRPNAVRRISAGKQNIAPNGYMTAEEWRSRCRKNISEIFSKHGQGLL